MAVGLNLQKELDADPKTILQQIKFARQLKDSDDNNNALDAKGKQSMFVLIILEKVKETSLKFSQANVTVYKR